MSATKYYLKKVQHPQFIINLIYASENNSFYKNMYQPFNLTECFVHPELYDALMQTVPALKTANLKLVIYDTFRPLDVQKFMYETAPDYLKPYIAPPPQPDSKRGFHPRGVAVDCYLADENGNALPFPTEPDAFYKSYENDTDYVHYLKKANRSYNEPDVEPERYANRQKLEDIMCGVGLEGLPTEWWHYQLPNAWEYPLIQSLKDVHFIDE